MDKVRKIIKLHCETGMSDRAIARAAGVSRPIVKKYIKTFETAEMDIRELDSISDSHLLKKLTLQKQTNQTKYDELADQFEYFIKELKRTGGYNAGLFEICCNKGR